MLVFSPVDSELVLDALCGWLVHSVIDRYMECIINFHLTYTHVDKWDELRVCPGEESAWASCGKSWWAAKVNNLPCPCSWCLWCFEEGPETISNQNCYEALSDPDAKVCAPEDVVPGRERPNVVYRIPCSDCPSTYVGERLRQGLERRQMNTRKLFRKQRLISFSG